jgi:hypothetical protein
MKKLKVTLKTTLIIALGLLACDLSRAQTSDVFTANELSLDAFGFYGSQNKDGGSGAWGPGAGINYFFTQNFGIGADTYADAFNSPYLLNANGIFRFPISRSYVAPYVFAGFGRQWEHEPRWTGDFGGGIEYRLSRQIRPDLVPQVGLFADVRGVFPTEAGNFAVLRFGIRFALK